MSSASSTIQVSGLAKEKLRALHAQAKAAGMTADAYARRLIEEGISLEEEARTRTFDEIMAPVREAAGPVDEAEVVALVEKVRRSDGRAGKG